MRYEWAILVEGGVHNPHTPALALGDTISPKPPAPHRWVKPLILLGEKYYELVTTFLKVPFYLLHVEKKTRKRETPLLDIVISTYVDLCSNPSTDNISFTLLTPLINTRHGSHPLGCPHWIPGTYLQPCQKFRTTCYCIGIDLPQHPILTVFCQELTEFSRLRR